MADIDDLLAEMVSQSAASKRLSTFPDCNRFRGVLSIQPEHRGEHLTLETLSGKGKISCPPYVLESEAEGELLAFYHLGSQLAGHAGICHGGLSAVLLDECMGRACFPKLPSRIGVTAKLELSYRAPIPLNQVIAIAAKVEKVEGRKGWVQATVEDPKDGTVFIEAKALFIEPKWAAQMSKVL
ncbi:Thioesterase/thiol ester dehydrase-isomerase [Thozetella sp. PMI_491]|nr:Thioesterase/thiol ester dehydrase-isomerase [Thozetella sp. PMI_491]